MFSPLSMWMRTQQKQRQHTANHRSRNMLDLSIAPGTRPRKYKKKTRWDVLDVVHHEGPAAGKASSICLFTQSRTREFLIWTEWQWQPSQVTTTTQKIKKNDSNFLMFPGLFFHIIYIHILILYRSRVMDEGNLFIRKTTEPDDDDDDDSFFFPSSFLFCFFFWSNFGSETNITAGWRKNLFIRTCFRFGAGGKEKKKRDVIRRPDSLFNWSSDLFVSFGVYLHKRIIGTDWPATENWPRWITKRKPDNIRSSIDRDKQRGRWPQTPKKGEIEPCQYRNFLDSFLSPPTILLFNCRTERNNNNRKKNPVFPFLFDHSMMNSHHQK